MNQTFICGIEYSSVKLCQGLKVFKIYYEPSRKKEIGIEV